VGSADGALPNGTGLEVRWMAEVGRAAAAQGVDLALAEAMVQPLLAMYEPVFSLPGGNPGVPFDKAYDLESLEPRQVWADLYDSEKRAVNQRIKLGI
jgi:methylamine--corrinoid protein Co-methyltransferase